MTCTDAVHVRKLRSTDLASVDFTKDTRGQVVVDESGSQVGLVDALFIDDAQRRIRFLRVSADGPANSDGRKFIVPVDAVRRIRGGTIHLDRERSALAAAPNDDSVFSAPHDVARLYQHYGFDPFWQPTYAYPPYPFYL